MKIMVLSSHTASLFWFRLEMMKNWLSMGHSVLAVGNESEEVWGSKFAEFGVAYQRIAFDRNGINPIRDFRSFVAVWKYIRQEKPNKIFAYQAKSVVYGSIAARLNRISSFYPMIAGVGSIFIGSGWKTQLVKSILILMYRLACSLSQAVFFQNRDDAALFIKHKIVKPEKIVMINGSGVNLDKFKSQPLPQQPRFLMIGRLIRDKGLIEYLNACELIKKDCPNIECDLVGPFDTNPSALTPEDLQPYIDRKIVNYWGEQTDVRPWLSQCQVFVLPSYHEGTPKTVLEAMATGRPIITCDVPGCRETVDPDVNGWLIPAKDSKALYVIMTKSISDYTLLEKMGKNSREIAERRFDVNQVNRTISRTMGLEEESSL